MGERQEVAGTQEDLTGQREPRDFTLTVPVLAARRPRQSDLSDRTRARRLFGMTHPSRPARRAATLIGATLVATTLALSGCGSPSPEEQARAKAAAEAARERKEAEIERLAKEAARTREDACRSGLGKLLTSASELNSRLKVGLNYSEYFDQVADLRVAYDSSNFDDLELPCMTGVGVRLERALNEFAGAARSWQRCMDDYGCDNDANTSRLQTRWRTADQQIEAAKDALDKLGEPDDELRDQAKATLAKSGTTPG